MRMLAGPSGEPARRPAPSAPGHDAEGNSERLSADQRAPLKILVPENLPGGDSGPLARPSIFAHRLSGETSWASAKSKQHLWKIAPLPESTIRPGQILCGLRDRSRRSKLFVKDYGLTPDGGAPMLQGTTCFNPSLAGIVEGVVSPRSSLIGQTIKTSPFSVKPSGSIPWPFIRPARTYYKTAGPIGPLQSGDAILVHGHLGNKLHAIEGPAPQT